MHWSLLTCILGMIQLVTLVNSDWGTNDCTPRKQINMNFPDIDGVYYLVLYVNETRMEERTSCIRITLKSDQETNTINETVEMIRRGSDQVSTIHLTSHYRSPGIIEMSQDVNGTTISYLDYIMEFTKGQSLISSVCQTNDGERQIDKIAVFFTRRDVSPDVILSKLRSVGITGSEQNTDYFFVPQFMCPN